MSAIPINNEAQAAAIIKKYIRLRLSSNDALSVRIEHLRDSIERFESSNCDADLNQRVNLLNEKILLEKELAVALGILTRRKIILPNQLFGKIKESFPILAEEQAKQASYIISKTVAQNPLEDWEKIPVNKAFKFSLEYRFLPHNTFFIKKKSESGIEVCISDFELLGEGYYKKAYRSLTFNISLLRHRREITDNIDETFFYFKCYKSEIERVSSIQKELIEKGVHNIADPISCVDSKHGRRRYYLGSLLLGLKKGIPDNDGKTRNIEFHEILQVFEDASLAVMQIHENEYIHFDVKSDNFELYFDDKNKLRCVVDDFDLIIPFSEIGEYNYKGTYFYQSKQCLYDHKVSTQSDVAGLIISLGEAIYNKYCVVFLNPNADIQSERIIFFHKEPINKFLISYKCISTFKDLLTEDEKKEFEEIYNYYNIDKLNNFIKNVYSNHRDEKEYKLMIAEINAVYSANALFYEMYKRDFFREVVPSKDFYDRLKELNDIYRSDIKKAENNEDLEFRVF